MQEWIEVLFLNFQSIELQGTLMYEIQIQNTRLFFSIAFVQHQIPTLLVISLQPFKKDMRQIFSEVTYLNLSIQFY